MSSKKKVIEVQWDHRDLPIDPALSVEPNGPFCPRRNPPVTFGGQLAEVRQFGAAAAMSPVATTSTILCANYRY